MLHSGLSGWLITGHVLGVILWVGSMFTVYWLLRFHTQAPPAAHDKLVLMERSMAMVMDLGALLAIGCGIGLIFPLDGTWHPDSTLFTAGLKKGWFHAKLTFVVLGVLSVHGFLRGRVAKFSRGQTPTVPAWPWSLLLVAVVGIVVMVMRRPF